MHAPKRTHTRALPLAVALAAPTCKLVKVGAGDERGSGAATTMAAVSAAAPSAVSAYTTGTISKTSVIRVQFAGTVATAEQIDHPLEDSPFSIEPEIEGVAIWDTATELQFRPAGSLAAGAEYNVELDLDGVLPEGSSDKSSGELEFSFAVMRQSLELSLGGLEAEDPKKLEKQQLSGAVITADVAGAAGVEKTLAAKHGSDELTITWSHADDGRRHN